MSKYDQEYYIAHAQNSPTQFHIAPDRQTEARDYTFERLEMGEAPLVFKNGFKDRDARLGERSLVTGVMYDGSSFAVSEEIKSYLGQFKIASMQHYPAIVIDDDNNWHDTYWYLNIYEDLDCWDRSKSIFKPDLNPIDEDMAYAKVKKYSLDEDILDAIPEEQRLIFRMDGATKAYVFMHKKIVKHFLENAYTGIRFFKVADFEEGDQNF